MGPKLSAEEIVTLSVLKSKGQSNTQIAQTLGDAEGTVRYQLRRQGQPNGRHGKPHKAAPLAEVIDHWVFTNQPAVKEGEPLRPVNSRALFDHLVLEHDYTGSYKSVLRFVRGRYPRPRLRPFRRVETPPGAQAQVDWGEFHHVAVTVAVAGSPTRSVAVTTSCGLGSTVLAGALSVTTGAVVSTVTRKGTDSALVWPPELAVAVKP
jgi:transposase